MKKNILIADDDKFYCEILKTNVEKLGYQSIVCHDGSEAISQLKSLQPSVSAVLLDIFMPGIDGISALGHLRNQYPDLPIIIITGSSDQEFKDNAKKLNAFYMQKPINAQTFGNQLQDIL